MNDLVSVVIPTYNRDKFIQRALLSVLSQSYKHYEIIIVDDGSTDNTREVLSKYSDSINYIYQDNMGVSSARNTAVKHANGKYIAFIDSDDEWLPNKLENQLKEFSFADNIAVVACNATVIELNGKKTPLNPKSKYKENISDFYNIFSYPYLGIPNVIVLKSVFEEAGGFNENLKTAEDIDLFIRISIKHNIRRVNEMLTIVHETKDSLSSNANGYDDNIKVFQDIKLKYENLFVNKEYVYNNTMAMLYEDYSRTLLWNKEYNEARKLLMISLGYKKTPVIVYLIFKSIILNILNNLERF